MESEHYDDVIVSCSSISSVCAHLHHAPVMSRGVAARCCGALLDSLRRAKLVRKAIGRAPAGGETEAVYHRLDRAHDDELAVHVFQAAFMLWATASCWRGQDGVPPIEFGECCGGVVKLDREDLVRSCCAAASSALDGAGVAGRIKWSDDDAGAVAQFCAAVFDRHPALPAATEVLRLALALGPAVVSRLPLADLTSTIVQLVSRGYYPAASLIADREVAVGSWYLTDVAVLVEVLRRHRAGEEDEVKAALLDRTARVALCDSIPPEKEGFEGLSRWVALLGLSSDYTEALRSRNVTASLLRGPLMGRLEVVEELGIEDAADADILFRVLAER